MGGENTVQNGLENKKNLSNCCIISCHVINLLKLINKLKFLKLSSMYIYTSV